MGKQVQCPQCNSNNIEDTKISENSKGDSFMYMEITCDNEHTYGVEYEAVAILN